MGMPIILDVPGISGPKPFIKVFSRFSEIDKRFSPYKSSSELSRYRRGEVEADNLSLEMRQVLTDCRSFQKKTGGYFSAWFDTDFEPSGYVKGWAIAEAAKLLEACSVKNFCISAGGDIMAVGVKTWRIGIQDPTDRKKLLAVIHLKDATVATSGSYERGTHIINPKTGRPASHWSSFSVVGPDIITADVLATAGFAADSKGLKIIEKQENFEALAIDKYGRAKTTALFGNYLA